MKQWLKKVVNTQKQTIKHKLNFSGRTEARVISFDKRQFETKFSKQESSHSQEQQQTQTEQPHIYTLQIARKYEAEQEWTDAQAEIVNQLINMDFLIKVTRNMEDQFIMLMELKRILCSESISVKQLKNFLNSRTLPFQCYPVRALIWKVTLGYLPQNKQKWISFMEGSLIKYQAFIKEFIVHTVVRKRLSRKSSHKEEMEHDESHWEEGRAHSDVSPSKVDHPLNSQKGSKWKNYFQDYELWNLIEQDTIRTRQTCQFFHQEHLFEMNYDNDKELINEFPPEELHLSKNSKKKTTFYYDSLTRILFIYCKQHPEIGYWQGMNELVAIIYYCFTNKNSEYFRRVGESDTYYVFTLIMERLGKKHFGSGERYASKFMELLQKVDLRLCEYLTENTMNLSVITIRWYLALFLNEFDIDNCLLFWDGIVGAPEQEKLPLSDYLMYLGLAIVHLNRQQIMDEGVNPMQIFSKISNNPREIIDKARSIYKLYEKII